MFMLRPTIFCLFFAACVFSLAIKWNIIPTAMDEVSLKKELIKDEVKN
jgi:hypothetical protein